MSRLRKASLDQFIVNNDETSKYITVNEISRDHQFGKHEPREMNYPGQAAANFTEGKFDLVINLGKIEQLPGDPITDVDINDLINKLKVSTTPNDLEDLIALDIYYELQFQSGSNSKGDKIKSIDSNVQNKIITVKYSFEFDGSGKQGQQDYED
jgi:hypothetical protein